MGTHLPYPSSLPQKAGTPPIFGPFLLWPNGWMHQDATSYGGSPQPRPYGARWGPRFPSKRGHSPQFSAHVYCGQTAGCIRIPLGTEVVLSVGLPHCVRWLDGDTATPPRCGQTAGWTKMPLGMEVDLGLGHIVLDGDPAPPHERGSAAPPRLFSPCVLWPLSRISATAELLLSKSVKLICGSSIAGLSVVTFSYLLYK